MNPLSLGCRMSIWLNIVVFGGATSMSRAPVIGFNNAKKVSLNCYERIGLTVTVTNKIVLVRRGVLVRRRKVLVRCWVFTRSVWECPHVVGVISFSKIWGCACGLLRVFDCEAHRHPVVVFAHRLRYPRDSDRSDG